MSGVDIRAGDCLEVMASLPPDHFDAVVTDPPYHLTSIVKRFGGKGAAPAQHGTDGLYQRSSRGFMGKEWDGGDIAFRPETWAAAYRVMKPGAHLVAFSAARTYPAMALAIEAAGFEVRDSILSLYDTGPAWSGFLDSLTPDQMDGLGRALAAADAPLLAWLYGSGFPKSHDVSKGIAKALGAEREVLGTVYNVSGEARSCMSGDFSGKREITAPATPEAAAWDGWGTALKPAWEPIVLARKPLAESSIARQHLETGTGGLNIDSARIPSGADKSTKSNARAAANGYGAAPARDLPADRWPANVVTDGSAEVRAGFPVDKDGSAARFFYSAKASAADRAGSKHPTVKPQSLMRWLVRLTTARGGRVLDPFAGSGSTGWAAMTEGRAPTLIDRDPEYLDHLRARAAYFDPEAARGSDTETTPDQLGLF
ncbi:DNA methylase [Dinoroseobacter phage vB_DshS-R4C]|nr:DNA methylase [Dinoroseobacter phage vB_DshS-R4C]